MRARTEPVDSRAAADPLWRNMYAAGGVSALLYVILIIIPMVLVFAVVQPPTSGGAPVLAYIASHKAAYIVELVCFVGLSVPALVVFLALSIALKDLGRTLAALGGLLGIVSETVALALGSSPPSLSGGLVYLSNQYAVAVEESSRAVLARAADGLIATSNAVSSAGILTAAGILVLSVLMRRGVFHRAVAYLGIATGVAGILCETFRPYVGMAYAVYGILLPAWFILVGWKLFSLRRMR